MAPKMAPKTVKHKKTTRRWLLFLAVTRMATGLNMVGTAELYSNRLRAIETLRASAAPRGLLLTQAVNPCTQAVVQLANEQIRCSTSQIKKATQGRPFLLNMVGTAGFEPATTTPPE